MPTVRRRNRLDVLRDIALVATFAAFIAVCAQFSLPAWVNGVPFSLQPFAVLLAGAVLGSRRGFLAVLLYLVVGAVGLPVFAGGTGGVSAFTGPTWGYLVSFPIAAFLIGLAVELTPARFRVGAILVGGLLGVGATWVIGSFGISRVAHLPYHAALTGAAAYLPADIVKLAIAGVIALSVHRAFPGLLGRTPKRADAVGQRSTVDV